MSSEREAARRKYPVGMVWLRRNREPRGKDLLRTNIRIAALLVVALATSAWPASLSPSAKEIVERSVQANATDWRAAPEYDYFERDKESDGGTKTYRVLMIEGSPYERLVKVNGQPISQAEQDEEQKKLDAVVKQRSNESAQARSKRIQQYESGRKRDHEMMNQLAVAFDFQLKGEQKLNGFDVYVLGATPRAGYQPPSLETRALTGMRGELWIDKKTFQWVKVEAEVIHPVAIEGFLATVEPGTRFELEKLPVGNGVWLAKHFSMKAQAKILEIFHHREQADETYFDYQKAASEQSPANGS